VKTIVRRSPILAAIRTAAWKESACRIPIAKKTTASVCGEASYLRVGERVDEQPLGRAADERDKRPERAGERRDRVVGAEQLRSVLDGGCVREHRLLERRERSRFDDLGRDGAGESGEDQHR
jgi:hypothetical protein